MIRALAALVALVTLAMGPLRAGADPWPSVDEPHAVIDDWERVAQPHTDLPAWANHPSFRAAARAPGALLILVAEPPAPDLFSADRMRAFINRSAVALQGVPGVEVWAQDVSVRPSPQPPVGILRVKLTPDNLPPEVSAHLLAALPSPPDAIEQTNLFMPWADGLAVLYLYRPWPVPTPDPLLDGLLSTFAPPTVQPPPPEPPIDTTRWWALAAALGLAVVLGLWRYTRWQRDRARASLRDVHAARPIPSPDSPTPRAQWEQDLSDEIPKPTAEGAAHAPEDRG